MDMKEYNKFVKWYADTHCMSFEQASEVELVKDTLKDVEYIECDRKLN